MFNSVSFLSSQAAVSSIGHLVRHRQKKNPVMEARKKALFKTDSDDDKEDACPPGEDDDDGKLVGCELGGDRGETPVFSRGMNPEHFAMALLALANLLYPVGDFSSRITNMIHQMNQDKIHADTPPTNRVHAATVWDSFDTYLHSYVDSIETLDPADRSSDGKALIQTVKETVARRGGLSPDRKLTESDKIEIVYSGEIMGALQEEGQLLPLRQIFDFYTMTKEQREQVLRGQSKSKSTLGAMWDPDTVWEPEKHEAQRMSLSAWGTFCGQCGLDERLNTGLGSCLAAMLERPPSSVDAVHGFLEGTEGFDPDLVTVGVDGFLESLRGVIMRHTLGKEAVRGEITRLDSKTMLKGMMEVLHQVFDKSPINRFLKLKNSLTTRVTKKRQLFFSV